MSDQDLLKLAAQAAGLPLSSEWDSTAEGILIGYGNGDLTVWNPLANDAEALLLRGRAHLALRHVAPAVADLRAAASRLPDRPEVHYQLALALEAASQRGDALKAAEQALRLAPDFADARSLSERLRR